MPTARGQWQGTMREAFLLGREHLRAEGVDSPEVEAEVLLRYAIAWDRLFPGTSPLSSSHHRGVVEPIPRSSLYARWESSLSWQTWKTYVDLLEERTQGRPLAYIIGRREFMGLDFLVDERVLIPRPETEVLVERLLRELAPLPHPLVVDVGTGSGAIAIALAVYHDGARVVATDLSGPALEVARENACKHGVSTRVAFLRGDLLDPLEALGFQGQVDAIATNPPYVPSGLIPHLPASIRCYEPLPALDGGEDGLEYIRRIVQQSPRFLRPGGLLAIEVMAGQADAVQELIERTGFFQQVESVMDLAGIPRVVVGWATAPGSGSS
ncbi:MAG: peptide chain release factor N(5)-glutamine methyltransferase [Armatimonadota bacterium]|nr:peptide chain release factor N(5)-glutamine methyltransferase [Armatimonadota bacterium]